MNILQEITTKKKIFTYQFPLPSPLTHYVSVYAVPLSLHNTVPQFKHTAHDIHHTFTHKPLKTVEPKVAQTMEHGIHRQKT
jgi:hypothetical protein